MNEQIKQIAYRLSGLRESLDLTVEEMAESIAIPATEYTRYESGEYDIPMSVLCKIAQQYGVETSTLVVEQNRVQSYFYTKKQRRISWCTKAYKYQDLSGLKTQNRHR